MLTTISYGVTFAFAIIVYAIITANLSCICGILDILLIASWAAILGSPWIAHSYGISWIPFAIGLGIFLPIIIWFGTKIGSNWH